MRNASKASTNTIFAAAKAVPERIPKPRAPAVKATRRKAIAQPSIKFLFALRGFTGVSTSRRRLYSNEPAARRPRRRLICGRDPALRRNDDALRAFNSIATRTKENWH